MSFILGSRSLKNLDRVQPLLVRVVKCAITRTDVDFGLTEPQTRTAAEQNQKYRDGVSQVDGYKRKGNHQITPDGYGHAVDLVPWIGGKFVWDDTGAPHIRVAWAMAQAARIEQVLITWGGNWYECLNDYGTSPEAIAAAVPRYKAAHPGKDLIDWPHFQLLP